MKSKRSSGSSAREIDRGGERGAQHQPAMAVDEGVDWAQHREAHFRQAALRGAQHGQQGRQQHDGEDEGDAHAEAGHGSELGHAQVAGRQKGEEARADGGGRQGQRLADRRTRRDQRRFEVRPDAPLGQAAHAELDAEIDAQPDEQRDEGHRYEIEAAGRHQADGRRQDQADQRGAEDRQHDAGGAHRQPQDAEKGRHHRAHDQVRIVGERAEFLVRQRHRAGQSHDDAVRRIQPERSRHAANGPARALPGLQLRVVHDRLDQDDAPCVVQRGRRADDQRPPGVESRLAGRDLLEGVRERRHLGLDILQLGLAAVDAQQDEGQHLQHAAQAGIVGERGQDRLHAHERFGGRFDVIGRQQQEPVVLEVRPAVGTSHIVEKVWFLLQRRREPLGPIVGQLGRGAVDHDHGEVLELRKRLIEDDLAMAPFQLRRDQLGGVGGHVEMAAQVDQRRRRQHDGGEKHDQRMAGAGRDDAAGQRSFGGHKASRRGVQISKLSAVTSRRHIPNAHV